MSITITPDRNRFLKRIKVRLDGLGAERDKVSGVLKEVGKLMRDEAKSIIQQRQIVDTGALRESMGFKVVKSANRVTMSVASFGIPYDRWQEEGATRTPASRRAMFAELRRRGVLGQRDAKFPGTNHPARPFLTPAFHAHARDVIPMLRKAFHKG